MGLFTKALVFGAGYALGHPEGRRRLLQLRQQFGQVADHPQVNRAKERAWDVAGEQALAVKNRVTSRSRPAESIAAPSTPPQRPRSAAPAAGGSEPVLTPVDTATSTAAAGTAAAADGQRPSPAPKVPAPPVPPGERS